MEALNINIQNNITEELNKLIITAMEHAVRSSHSHLHIKSLLILIISA